MLRKVELTAEMQDASSGRGKWKYEELKKELFEAIPNSGDKIFVPLDGALITNEDGEPELDSEGNQVYAKGIRDFYKGGNTKDLSSFDPRKGYKNLNANLRELKTDYTIREKQKSGVRTGIEFTKI